MRVAGEGLVRGGDGRETRDLLQLVVAWILAADRDLPTLPFEGVPLVVIDGQYRHEVHALLQEQNSVVDGLVESLLDVGCSAALDPLHLTRLEQLLELLDFCRGEVAVVAVNVQFLRIRLAQFLSFH